MEETRALLAEGRWNEARERAERLRDAAAAGSIERAESAELLAEALLRRGEFGRVRALLREAVGTRERAHGPDAVETARTLSALARADLAPDEPHENDADLEARYAEGHEALDRALAVFSSRGLRLPLSAALLTAADFAAGIGEHESAVALYNRILGELGSVPATERDEVSTVLRVRAMLGLAFARGGIGTTASSVRELIDAAEEGVGAVPAHERAGLIALAARIRAVVAES